MSFSFKPVQGDARVIAAELQNESQHTRENEVIPVVTEAIDKIVNTLGGYLSIDASGHINAAQNEPGDTVNIRIVSLPVPGGDTPTEATSVSIQSPEKKLTTEEALAQTIAQRAPGGSVAPPPDTVTENGAPGITSAPVENPTVSATTTNPVGAENITTPTSTITENAENAPESIGGDAPLASEQNSLTEVAGENVAQIELTPDGSPAAAQGAGVNPTETSIPDVPTTGYSTTVPETPVVEQPIESVVSAPETPEIEPPEVAPGVTGEGSNSGENVSSPDNPAQAA